MPDLRPFPEFPKDEELACASMQEAARHLQDARILHVSKRYPAAITSSMKAAEIGLKSLLISHGAKGWLDSTLNTHSVVLELTKATSGSGLLSDMVKSLLDSIRIHDATLLSDMETLEQLVPYKPDVKKLSFDEAANTEYPFFAFVTGSPPNQTLNLYRPESHCTQSESKRHFTTAFRLLNALPVLAPEMSQWKVRLCRIIRV